MSKRSYEYPLIYSRIAPRPRAAHSLPTDSPTGGHRRPHRSRGAEAPDRGRARGRPSEWLTEANAARGLYTPRIARRGGLITGRDIRLQTGNSRFCEFARKVTEFTGKPQKPLTFEEDSKKCKILADGHFDKGVV